MSTIYILWLRQLKRYFRSRSRMIGSLGQPILFLVAFGFGFGPIFQRAGQGNYIEFLAPGIIAMSMLFTAMFSGMNMIWDRQFGFLKETLVAPVPRIIIMFGRILGGATEALIQGLIVLIISMLIGFHINSISYFGFALLFMALISLLFTAFGSAIATVMKDMQGFQLIMNFIVMPLLFLSGAFFPISGLPQALLIFASLNPLSYGVDGLHFALTGTAHFGPGIDILVLSVLSFVLLVTGSYLFSKIEV